MVSPRISARSVAAAALLLVSQMPVAAQEARNKQIILPRGSYLQLTMAAGQLISSVETLKGKIVRVTPTTSPKSIGLRGIAVGSDWLILQDDKRTKETYEVIVREQVLVPVGVAVTWTWPEGKSIKKLAIENGKLARLRLIAGDDKSVNIEPLEVGNTRFTLTDAEGTAHMIELGVRKPDRLIAVGEEVELRAASKKALRWANIQDGSIIGARLAGPNSRLVTPEYSTHLEIVQFGKEGTILPIVGSSVGLTQVSLTDDEGKDETLYIAVRPKK